MSEGSKMSMQKEFEIAMAEEKAIAEVQTMAIRILMAKGISKTELATAMGVSAARVSQLLGDEPKNLSIRKAANLFYHLGEELTFSCKGIEQLNMIARRKREQNKRIVAEPHVSFRWAKSTLQSSNDDSCAGKEFVAA